MRIVHYGLFWECIRDQFPIVQEQVALEVEAAGGRPSPAEVQQRLEQVSGVSRVVMKDAQDSKLCFEVESLQGRQIRADVARSVVNAGWGLSELRAVGLSLEDIFLHLTGGAEYGEW